MRSNRSGAVRGTLGEKYHFPARSKTRGKIQRGRCEVGNELILESWFASFEKYHVWSISSTVIYFYFFYRYNEDIVLSFDINNKLEKNILECF